jgi:CBS domain-containing protein
MISSAKVIAIDGPPDRISNMSLEQFRRTRLVILNPKATAYQAARAMEDNHIGAVLVSDQPGVAGIVTDRDLAIAIIGGKLNPQTTPVSEIMSEEVITCDIGDDMGQLVRLMTENGIRRIPLMEGARPVGFVTFDDIVVDGSADLEDLREIVSAQLEVEAPHKPAGMLHPSAAGTAQSRTRALMRAKARAEATYGRMIQAVAETTGLGRAHAERALLIACCMLCRRLTPDEAQDLIAQLPSMLKPHLDQCLSGPDREVTRQVLEEEVSNAIGATAESASRLTRAIFEIIVDNVSPGQIAEVQGQLPEDMADLFSAGS